jgi:hypothetical protein
VEIPIAPLGRDYGPKDVMDQLIEEFVAGTIVRTIEVVLSPHVEALDASPFSSIHSAI